MAKVSQDMQAAIQEAHEQSIPQDNRDPLPHGHTHPFARCSMPATVFLPSSPPPAPATAPGSLALLPDCPETPTPHPHGFSSGVERVLAVPSSEDTSRPVSTRGRPARGQMGLAVPSSEATSMPSVHSELATSRVNELKQCPLPKPLRCQVPTLCMPPPGQMCTRSALFRSHFGAKCPLYAGHLLSE